MKPIPVFLFALSNLLVVNSVAARDWKETLRDRRAQCSHLTIHDSDSLLLDHMRDCCLFARETRNCQLLDRSSFEHR
jgi:hypothetical protein